jgi:ubiquinone/menaquinone biosynthesis C-methylase UbiE
LDRTSYGERVAPSRETVRRHYDFVAKGYDARNRVIERRLLARQRVWLGREAAGRTLELGVGTGLNIAHYVDAQVVGIDLSANMLAAAHPRLSRLALADAAQLPFPPEVFDTVTTTLVLSAVPDLGHALREARRVLRPGGRLLAIEKTRSRSVGVRLIQRVLGPVWSRIQGGDRFGHDLAASLHHAGFDVRVDGTFAAGFMARIDGRRRD